MCKVFCCNPVVRNGNKETTDALIRAMRDEALKRGLVREVPIVTSLYKTKNFKNPCLEGRSVPYDTIALMYVHIEGFDSDFCINQGYILVLDICDTWYAFSKAGWEKHKNDEV